MKRHRYHYGEDASQWGELFLPELPALPGGGMHRGVVVVIHGGYWRSQYGAELGEPIARDLAAHGMAAWNLEYRRAGNGRNDLVSNRSVPAFTDNSPVRVRVRLPVAPTISPTSQPLNAS